MQYVSAEDIIYIHDIIIRDTGGSPGLRERGLLDSIVKKPHSSFGGHDLYPALFDKAATIYEALRNYRVFIDGNKRTAALSMYRLLAVNGYGLSATNKQLEDYTLFMATDNPDLVYVADWIKAHSEQVNT
jgi:death-on-curing protein